MRAFRTVVCTEHCHFEHAISFVRPIMHFIMTKVQLKMAPTPRREEMTGHVDSQMMSAPHQYSGKTTSAC
jgi:hypothetical protein